jgi:hypothetical protein
MVWSDCPVGTDDERHILGAGRHISRVPEPIGPAG